ncbi:argininosuccinate lyase [Rothia sp. AR01]|uniref:Argininosuccinate lyase n=1 Tax=Rothia santali TaxID=2949643 RepID=A0A9X2HCF9_9MICC|nr:argininosuccinate lyase [Rothia santali]MCP3425570.1 argininosuccinate lyase [Rothia santali]
MATTDEKNGGGAHAEGKLWGGRFTGSSAPALERLSRSPERYFTLVPEDVTGSLAHAGELERAGLITAEERERIAAAFEQLAADHRSGAISPQPQDEDVHGYLERELIQRLGPLGGKIRAGRSRNDQTANDLRLHLRRVIPEIAAGVEDLAEALLERSRDVEGFVAPGFTHLQNAQPILFSQQLLAHAFPLTRDLARLENARLACMSSPLGAAAMAGSTLAGDQRAMAADMGYADVVQNSIDAVSSRDHVVDFLYAGAMLGTDLSRLCEEVCLWSSQQFGWARLDDAWSTGSSIMPQKKNPDIAELARGKTGRLIANLSGMLATLKSLPFAYNRDLSEDKHYVLDTAETLRTVLPALTGLIRTVGFDAEAMRRQAVQGFTLATEIADWLAEQGLPFSEAHDVAGRSVVHCETRGIGLEDLTAEDLAVIDERLTPEVLERISLESAVSRRTGVNGTSPERIRDQQAALAALLEASRSDSQNGRSPQ